MEEITIQRNIKDELKNIHKNVLYKLAWGNGLIKEEKDLLEAWKINYKIDEDILRFYTDKRILYEIVKYLGNKELIFDKKIRWLYASKIQYLLDNMFFYRVFENPKTFYCGLAGFKEREPAPLGFVAKREWQDEYWTHAEHPAMLEKMNGLDFAIDIDFADFLKSFKEAKKLFDYFNKFKIRFSVWCSGKKGFHIRIPYEEFKNMTSETFNVDEEVRFSSNLALQLAKELKMPILIKGSKDSAGVDTSIYSATRYIKCPYTLDTRNKRVVWPLSDGEFLDFERNYEKYMSIDYALSHKNLGYRGAYINKETNPDGFADMCEELWRKER